MLSYACMNNSRMVMHYMRVMLGEVIMKTVLVVCPTARDKREWIQTGMAANYTTLFYEYDDQVLEKIIGDGVGWLSYDFKPAQILNTIVEYARKHTVDAIVYSEDYPGSILGAITAQTIGVIGPNPRVVIGHQHKYYSRLWQQEHVPEATPNFWLVDPGDSRVAKNLTLPIFLKPVKSFFSILANEINSEQELYRCLNHARMPVEFLTQFDWFLDQGKFDLSARHLIAEQVLHGEQCTLEGFVHNGEVAILGVTDSIMFPGTISFKRFEYPSCLPQAVCDRMASISTRLMQATWFDNSFFNIEFVYDQIVDQLFII